jgi:hypothetical protein
MGLESIRRVIESRAWRPSWGYLGLRSQPYLVDVYSVNQSSLSKMTLLLPCVPSSTACPTFLTASLSKNATPNS